MTSLPLPNMIRSMKKQKYKLTVLSMPPHKEVFQLKGHIVMVAYRDQAVLWQSPATFETQASSFINN